MAAHPGAFGILIVYAVHWSRHELLKSYETGVWVFLIIAAAAFLGLILWMGYAILL
jgi:hypothetical protein